MNNNNEIPLTDITVEPTSQQSTSDDQKNKSSDNTCTCDDCCE